MTTSTRDDFVTRPYRLSLLLAAAMAVSTVAQTLVGVLGPYLQTELGLTPADLGVLVAVFSAVSGAMAWPAGTLTDSIGGRRSVILVFLGSVIGLVTMASAVSYSWLLVAMVVAGLANSAANPATNLIIAGSVPPGERGLVAGIKMAGVQMGVFAAGVAIPPVAERFGWRRPLALAGAAIAAVAILGVLVMLEDRTGKWTERRGRLQWSSGLVTLTGYTLLMSAGAGIILTYMPLYTVESLGSTPQIGGLAVAIIGLLAIGGRLALGRVTERLERPMRVLAVVGALSLVSTALVLVSSQPNSPLFWLGIAGLGLSAMSFIAGTTVVLILSMPREQLGGASGVMFIGFMVGYGLGPVAFGLTVEGAGGYVPGWVLTMGLFAVAAGVAWYAAIASPARG